MDTCFSEIRKALDEYGIKPTHGHSLDEIADFFARINSYDRYINIDFNDYIAIIRSASTICIATETVSYDNIGKALSSMLATTVDGRKPSSVLVNFNIGPDFMMEHMNLVSEAFAPLSSDAEIIWGMSHSNSPVHEVEVAAVLGFKQ